MNNVSEAWVLVVDSEQARLLRATSSQHGKVHLDEVTKLATSFQASEHHRPTRMGHPGQGNAEGHEPERKLAHFARQVTAWIAPELVARSIDQCNLFAPSHMLGALRSELPKPVAGKLREHAAELAHMSAADLSKHPSIGKLLAK